jgi:hypothetical protein
MRAFFEKKRVKSHILKYWHHRFCPDEDQGSELDGFTQLTLHQESNAVRPIFYSGISLSLNVSGLSLAE